MHQHSSPARLRSSIALCFALIVAGTVQAQVNKKGTPEGDQASLKQAYVTINGEVQSNARAEVLIREQLARGVSDSPELRNSIREALVNQTILAQQARKDGLEKNLLIQAQIELAQQNILAIAWQQKMLSEVRVSDEEVKAEYDRQVERMGKEEYLVRHLLVADESSAHQLIERIRGGAKMSDLAAGSSRDADTKNRGGLAGWISVGNLLMPIAQAVAKLDKGELSLEPVQTTQGWHVLQLEDKRALTPPTLEASKAQVVDALAHQALEAKAQTIKKQASIQ